MIKRQKSAGYEGAGDLVSAAPESGARHGGAGGKLASAAARLTSPRPSVQQAPNGLHELQERPASRERGKGAAGRPEAPIARHSEPAAPDLDGTVGAAVAELTTRSDHGAGGRFTKGNTAAWKTGARSQQLPLALADAKAELNAKVGADLGLDTRDGGAAETLLGTADAYAEARLLRTSLFHTLAQQGGPVTGKGRTRAALTTYLAVLDRELRLATALGFERRARPTNPVEAVRRAVELANETPIPLSRGLGGGEGKNGPTQAQVSRNPPNRPVREDGDE